MKKYVLALWIFGILAVIFYGELQDKICGDPNKCGMAWFYYPIIYIYLSGVILVFVNIISGLLHKNIGSSDKNLKLILKIIILIFLILLPVYFFIVSK